jgi:hypothetical protein
MTLSWDRRRAALRQVQHGRPPLLHVHQAHGLIDFFALDSSAMTAQQVAWLEDALVEAVGSNGAVLDQVVINKGK